jgi:hypothetical protein
MKAFTHLKKRVGYCRYFGYHSFSGGDTKLGYVGIGTFKKANFLQIVSVKTKSPIFIKET